MFIAFEGGEGAGKTTQIKKIANYIQEQGKKCFITREPGGTKTAEAIRNIVLDDENNFESLSLVLLFTTARHEHIQKIIKPKLDEGYIILCDRYIYSTLAYQGLEGVKENTIMELHKSINYNLMPDVTFLLDIDSELGIKRVINRADKQTVFDKKSLEFHKTIRQNFLKIAKNNNKTYVIDASKSENEVTLEIISKINLLINGLN